MGVAKKPLNANDIVFGGISTALIIISLYAGTLVKNSSIFFMVVSNYLSSLPYIKSKIRLGFVVYLSSVCLAFMIIPDKMYAIGYLITGIYPLIKLVSENNKAGVEFILKLLYYNAAVIAMLYIAKEYINVSFADKFLNTPIFIFLAIIILQVLFLIYDYIFSIFIKYVNNKFIDVLK